MYQYQRLMHISYNEAVMTPLNVVTRQLAYESIEKQVKGLKQQDAQSRR